MDHRLDQGGKIAGKKLPVKLVCNKKHVPE